jgi:hypothetical protein
MRRVDTWRWSLGLLVGMGACSSSEAVDPETEAAQQLATTYCEECCVQDGGAFDCFNSQEGCTALITQTLLAVCQEETAAYYQCLIDNSCKVDTCDAEWTARETCLVAPEDAGTDASTDSGT